MLRRFYLIGDRSSAAATAANVAKGLAAGFDRYLTKPYDVHELLNAVAEAQGARSHRVDGRSSHERAGTMFEKGESAQ